MVPFKVTFTLTSPVVTDSEYPVHLDALLAWAEADEAEAFGQDNPWELADDLSHLLDSEGEGDHLVWKASILRFTPASEKLPINMTRKCNPEDYLRDLDRGAFKPKRSLTRVNTRSGQLRAFKFYALCQWMEKVEAWGVGDLDLVRERLGRLHNIGKLARNGFGMIREVVVEPCDEAAELWRVRVLPKGIKGAKGVHYAPGLHCLRAPYWKKINQVEALEPIV
jgi:CRISPR type IV-associated protein Csf3